MPTVRLGDVVERIKDNVDKDNTDLEYYIGGEHFDYGEVVIKNRAKLAGSTIGPAFHMRFMPGDVLLMSRNPHLRKAGMVDFEGICSDVSYVCRTKNEDVLMQKFLPFLFQTDHFWEFAEANKKGSTNFFLNWSDFERYEFNLPGIEEQRKLTTVLWAAEETKLAYENMVKQTDDLIKAKFIDMFGLPDSNSHNFDIGKIGDVVSDVHYGTAKKATEDGDYYYIRMNNITYDGDLDLSDMKRISVPEKELKGCLAVKGDVLFNRTNSRDLVGKTCAFKEETPMVVAGYIIRVRLNKKVCADYLATYLNLNQSKRMLYKLAKGAVGQANINAQELQSIAIVIPPISVQEEFQAINDRASESKRELKQAIANTDALIRMLMQ